METLSPPLPQIIPLQPPFAAYDDDAGLGERATSESKATIVEQAHVEQAPPTSNRSRTSTAERAIEQSAQDLMDISSSSEEEGEITNSAPQETTDEIMTYVNEHGDTNEQLTQRPTDSVITQEAPSRSQQLSSRTLQEGNPRDTNQLISPVDSAVKTPSAEAQIQESAQILTRVADLPRELIRSPRKYLEAESSSDKPLEIEASEDFSDLADSEIYEPPEPIAMTNAEAGKLDPPPSSTLPSNATVRFEDGGHMTPSGPQETTSIKTAFQTVEMPSTVEPAKVSTLLPVAMAQFAHISVGCKFSNATADRALCSLRESVEAIQGIPISSAIYLGGSWRISVHDLQS